MSLAAALVLAASGAVLWRFSAWDRWVSPGGDRPVPGRICGDACPAGTASERDADRRRRDPGCPGRRTPVRASRDRDPRQGDPGPRGRHRDGAGRRRRERARVGGRDRHRTDRTRRGRGAGPPAAETPAADPARGGVESDGEAAREPPPSIGQRQSRRPRRSPRKTSPRSKGRRADSRDGSRGDARSGPRAGRCGGRIPSARRSAVQPAEPAAPEEPRTGEPPPRERSINLPSPGGSGGTRLAATPGLRERASRAPALR